MKRFLADAALIIILVVIGSSLRNDSKVGIEEQIDAFEQGLHTNAPWEETVTERFYTIEENKASTLARSMSEIVVDTVATGTMALTDFFTSLLV